MAKNSSGRMVVLLGLVAGAVALGASLLTGGGGSGQQRQRQSRKGTQNAPGGSPFAMMLLQSEMQQQSQLAKLSKRLEQGLKRKNSSSDGTSGGSSGGGGGGGGSGSSSGGVNLGSALDLTYPGGSKVVKGSGSRNNPLQSIFPGAVKQATGAEVADDLTTPGGQVSSIEKNFNPF